MQATFADKSNDSVLLIPIAARLQTDVLRQGRILFLVNLSSKLAGQIVPGNKSLAAGDHLEITNEFVIGLRKRRAVPNMTEEIGRDDGR